MQKRLSVLVIIGVLLVVIFLCRRAGVVLSGSIQPAGETVGKTQGVVNSGIVVVDPGHGGIDGGKVAVNGAEEKDVNLEIALIIKKLLEEQGVEVIMTRTKDKRLGSTQSEDLKERVRIINDNQPVLAVSIHQNSYHEESVNGAQIFYYTDSEKGKRAAMVLQGYLEEMEPDSIREAKANNTYYILKNTKVPTVIVECGFLSNRSDAQKLVDGQYQQKIARAIAEGALEWCSGE